jgi:N,N-dimethylformamidase
MKVVGYSDRLSVTIGEIIRFMISCELPTYRADIVRLIHGDPHPHGPGLKEELIANAASKEYPGRFQQIYRGSYVRIADAPALRLQNSFTLQAWILPTTPQKGRQGIITKWLANNGYGLCIDEHGALALKLGTAQGPLVQVSSGKSLRKGEWYFIAATFDAQSGVVRVYQEPLREWPQDESRAIVEQPTILRAVSDNTCDLLIAASCGPSANGKTTAHDHFNGKIDSPRLFARVLNHEELLSLKRGGSPLAFGSALVAAWDFSLDISSRKVTDTSPHQLHGETVNMPARAMTGHNWTGQETNFRYARHEYGAIHFHDDDLEDAGWDVDFSLVVPEQMKSGIYAARLRTAEGEDYVPFVVRPKKGAPTARAAFLLPTCSYLAYANEQLKMSYHLIPNQLRGAVTPEDEYSAKYGLVSLYDRHTDRSGVCYSSRLRPIMNLRPTYQTRILRCSHQFPADLHLIAWLEAKGHDYDVITDEDLHHEGLALLSSYKVILTGSHPEYWTGAMLAAIETYLQHGGRLMYLGGNGFYWVMAIDPQRPHVVEVRRWSGARMWDANPGEYYLSTTGELGGLWRHRGRAPQKLAGVGFTAQGFDNNRPYQRQPGSFDPRVAFIFAGIDKDELIGDFPSLVLDHGAAGLEIDRADTTLGTPPHALILASASGYSDSYQHVVEEVLVSDSRQGGTVNRLVRADMVYFECPNGGAVFSTGSIAWCGSLSYNNYDNNVSRVTDNVLRRFVADAPLPERGNE